MRATLGTKIAGLAAASVLLAALALGVLAGRRQEAALERALDRRAATIASTLGLAIANDIITGNVANIERTVEDIVGGDDEILVVTIWGSEGGLLATVARPGAQLEDAFRVRLPVLVPGTDVRLGTVECLFTRSGMRREARAMWTSTAAAAAGVGAVAVLVALGVAARIARPVRRLEAAARRVAGGDLAVRVEAETRDEVGRLAGEFNAMVGEIGSARAALERKIHELSALYDASRVIQSSADLDEVLSLALEALTTGLGLSGAAVAVQGEGGLRVAAARGIDGATGAFLDAALCEGDVREAAEADLPPPFRGRGGREGGKIARVAPMRVAGRPVGTLVALGGDGEGIDRFLAVLASQLAPAIEAAARAGRAREAVADPFTPLARRVGEEIAKVFERGLPLSVVRFRLEGGADKAAREGWSSVDSFFEAFLAAVAEKVPEAAVVARFGPISAVAVLPALSKAEARALLMRLDAPGMDEVESTVVTHPEDGASALELLAKV